MSESRATLESVVIGLGSNLGPRAQYLASARRLIEERKIVAVRGISDIIETPAMGPPQPDYLNQVLRGVTSLGPIDLLAALHGVEAALGRARRERWGPRTIDLDILDYGGQVIRLPELEVPHPEIRHREFVLEPWSHLDPGYVLPGLERSIADLLAAHVRKPRTCGS